MKILFCHDGSRKTDHAVEELVFMFRHAQAEIILLTIVEEALDASSEHEESFESEMSKRREAMAAVSGKITRSGLAVEVLIYSGGPKKTILKVAALKKPGLIAVARRKEGNLLQKLYGSTSDFLIRNAPCPVLVFHEDTTTKP